MCVFVYVCVWSTHFWNNVIDGKMGNTVFRGTNCLRDRPSVKDMGRKHSKRVSVNSPAKYRELVGIR